MSEHELQDQALFNSIAEAYLAKDLAPASRAARRHRLRQTLGVVDLSTDARLLEVGAGAGFSAEYLAGHFREFHGVDYSENLIAFAERRHGSPAVQFAAQNIKDYVPSAAFDAILMIGVLHHLDDMEEVLRHLLGMLRPGGWLLANEPQPANPVITLARSLRKRFDPSYSADQRELSAEELRISFENAGYADVRLAPQGILSTPFAEVILKPQAVTRRLSEAACRADELLERALGSRLERLSWNLVVAGKAPGGVP